MIRRILIPLDPSPYSASAVEIGCKIGQLHDAEITGIVILDVPGLEKSIGAVPPGGIYWAEHLEKHKLAEAEKKISTILEEFRNSCEEWGVKHKEARYQGIPSQKIAEESMFYDLVIMGLKSYYDFDEESKYPQSMVKNMGQMITPVLGVSPNAEVPNIASGGNMKVLMPFNGSVQSARVLIQFSRIAATDDTEIMLLMADKDKDKAHTCLAKAKDYLNAAGFTNVTAEVALDVLDIRSAVEVLYNDWADICVVGAHSKRGMLDFMVGSLTTYLIEKDEKPILIGQ